MKTRTMLRIRATFIAAILALIFSSLQVLAQEPLTFAVIGDTGEPTQPQRDIALRMKAYRDTRGRFDFVLMLGDNIYDDGVGRGFRTHFENPYRELLSAGVRFYAVLGNHDVREGTEDQIDYAGFNMGGRRYYSFKMGSDLVEFFALDSSLMSEEAENIAERQLKDFEVSRAKNIRLKSALERRRLRTRARNRSLQAQESEIRSLDDSIAKHKAFRAGVRSAREQQLPWLVQSLQQSTARWKVVFLHHAIYSTGSHGTDGDVLRLRRMLEPILIEKKVNVVFAGHDHAVEQIKPQGRSHRVYYITQGAGSRLRPGDLERDNPLHEWGEDRKYSFLVVRLTESEMTIEVIDSTGREIRRFSIPKLN